MKLHFCKYKLGFDYKRQSHKRKPPNPYDRKCLVYKCCKCGKIKFEINIHAHLRMDESPYLAIYAKGKNLDLGPY